MRAERPELDEGGHVRARTSRSEEGFEVRAPCHRLNKTN